MNLKPLSIKSKKRKEKAIYVTLDSVNKYLCNRRLKKLVVTGTRVTMYLVDGRRVIVDCDTDTSAENSEGKIRVKNTGDLCLTERDVEEYNYHITKVIEAMKKDIPRECRSCVATLDFT